MWRVGSYPANCAILNRLAYNGVFNWKRIQRFQEIYSNGNKLSAQALSERESPPKNWLGLKINWFFSVMANIYKLLPKPNFHCQMATVMLFMIFYEALIRSYYTWKCRLFFAWLSLLLIRCISRSCIFIY